jgi:hypothetical protein
MGVIPLVAAVDVAGLMVCRHRWTALVNGERRCLAGCRAVAIGGLAEEPPAQGLDLDRVVLVDLALARDSLR